MRKTIGFLAALACSVAFGPALAQEGETLLVALPSDISSTDSAFSGDSSTEAVARQAMEGLVRLKPGSLNEVEPVLAEALPTVSDDGLVYTFKIRKGVKFHDGEPLDADAVKFNYDRWLKMPDTLTGYSYGKIGSLQQSVDKVVVDDPTTVSIHLKKRNSGFLISQVLPAFAIASPAALREGKADNSVTDRANIPYAQGSDKALVGTGPFVFQDWKRGSEVELVKNEEYWNAKEQGNVGTLVFRIMTDPTATLNALQSGSVDVAQILSPQNIKLAKDDDTLQVLPRNGCSMAQIYFNQKFPPFDAVKVRQAVGTSIDRQLLVDKLFDGNAAAADGFLPKGFPFAVTGNIPTYNAAGAKELVSALKPEQRTLEFWYPSNVSRPYMPDPQALFDSARRDLEAAGFTVVPKTTTWSDYLTKVFAGEVPMSVLGNVCNWPSPDNFFGMLYFGFPAGSSVMPEMGYGDDELKQMLQSATSSATKDEEAKVWAAFQNRLGQDLPFMPLLSPDFPAVASTAVKGFVTSPFLGVAETYSTVTVER
ncbi:ABC transporter substrate-binding protein [Pararhizobium arenae]|uniref:ABC transporter substrate-binding protein n=1 Tax=Pararhizobium arenae TaxID=1856850 RepID=UPI00094B1F84|nr:ABC transporter substrate-binding protein [Pararhizobium arenae]